MSPWSLPGKKYLADQKPDNRKQIRDETYILNPSDEIILDTTPEISVRLSYPMHERGVRGLSGAGLDIWWCQVTNSTICSHVTTSSKRTNPSATSCQIFHIHFVASRLPTPSPHNRQNEKSELLELRETFYVPTHTRKLFVKLHLHTHSNLDCVASVIDNIEAFLWERDVGWYPMQEQNMTLVAWHHYI